MQVFNFFLKCFLLSVLVLSSLHCQGKLPSEASIQGDPVSKVHLNTLQHQGYSVVEPVWDFFWNRYIEPGAIQSSAPERLKPDFRVQGMRPWTRLPGTTGKGYASYRTLLDLPQGRPIAFILSQQLTSARVYVDGQLLASDGHPGTSETNTEPSRGELYFEYTPRKPRTEIILHIANFHTFRGGLRAAFEIGWPDKIKTLQNRRDFLEILATGFLGAIAFYNLFLFWMQRREKAYLVFAFLCLSFALRIPLLGERTIHDIWPELNWEWQYRFNMTLNILSPPLMLMYFRGLFPSALGRIPFAILLSVCGAFVVTLIADTAVLAMLMYGYYLFVAGPVLLICAYIVLIRSFQEAGSTRIMGFGMVIVCIFGLLAIFQNWQSREGAADLAVLAFVSFGLFQGIGVAQRHKESLENEKALGIRLERSKEALIHQRQSLENDLHDTLGSKLVDLQIQLSRELGPGNSSSLLQTRVAEINDLFRGELLFMEDLEFASREPTTGIQLSLLRRYSDSGRELIFQCERPDALDRALSDDALRMDFLQLTRELCTNDLKYGTGESVWRLAATSDSLLLSQKNRIRNEAAAAPIYARTEPEEEPETHLAVHARKRAGKMGGVTRVRILGESYCFRAKLPY